MIKVEVGIANYVYELFKISKLEELLMFVRPTRLI